jgi:hypothetical protein
VALKHLPTSPDGRRPHTVGDVRFERQDRFRLLSVALEGFHERLVDPSERFFKDLLPDAASERLGANACEPL